MITQVIIMTKVPTVLHIPTFITSCIVNIVLTYVSPVKHFSFDKLYLFNTSFKKIATKWNV